MWFDQTVTNTDGIDVQQVKSQADFNIAILVSDLACAIFIFVLYYGKEVDWNMLESFSATGTKVKWLVD